MRRSPRPAHPSPARRAFTLVELLVALTILGLLTVMLFTSFNAVTRAWEEGRAAIDASGHADYLMEQLTAAIRSAYYPGAGEKYGLVFVDDGDDPRAHDTIEWTKVGSALVGEDADFAPVPHRVRVTVTEPDAPFPGGFTVRAWRQDLQLDDFDPERDTAELCLSPKVIGFNCRLLDPETPTTESDDINWVDEWTKTNSLPTALELTLWMEPPDPDSDPICSQRIVQIPMGILAQNPSLASSANEEAKSGTSTSVGGRRRHKTQVIDTSNGVFTPGSGNGQRPAGGTGSRPGQGSRPSGGGASRPSNGSDNLFNGPPMPSPQP